MAVQAEGTQTAVISTEHTLATVTADGVYVLNVDCAEMTDGTTPDILRIRLYSRARSISTERLVEVYELIGAQGKPLFTVVPRVEMTGNFRATIEQTQGTGRNYPWSIVTP